MGRSWRRHRGDGGQRLRHRRYPEDRSDILCGSALPANDHFSIVLDPRSEARAVTSLLGLSAAGRITPMSTLCRTRPDRSSSQGYDLPLCHRRVSTMTLASLAFTYVLGGLTFVPLLLVLILVPAWYLLPTADRSDAVKDVTKRTGQNEELADSSSVDGQDLGATGDGAASGTFAVLRSYHFQSALTALNAKTGNAANTNGTIEGAPDTSGESVYQSMYRSVFDRNKSANTTSALLQQEETADEGNAKARRKTVPTSVFYIVLRHGHLMLYDSSSQMEVRHVISLAHHSVSLSDGEPGDPMMDADLFIKRTAIVLTPKTTPDGLLRQQSARPKPFYLFSTLCSDKEDFYQALLTTRPVPPVPQTIAPEAAIKLQSALHSSALTPETRVINALLGRIFLSLHRTPFLENFVRTKIENKIARVQKPAYLAALTVQSIDLGDAAPILSNPRLRDFNISGELTLSLDVRYTGGVKVVIAALAKIDLGSRFKARTIELVLATSVQRVSGHILVRIKPPPANRIWFTFESMPEMDIKVEPVVSQRQITYTFILRAIEERIRGVVGETLVKPNWDDVPFFDTRMQHVRGGIWKDEGKEVEEEFELRSSEPKIGDMLKEKNEKTMSMPALPSDTTFSSATSTGSESIALPTTLRSRDQASELNRRSVASLPGTAAIRAATIAAETDPPRPLRSPSFTSPSVPVVALNGANVAPVRADDATLQPAARRWISRTPQPIPNWRDAMEGLKEMRDRGSARDMSESVFGHSPRGSITGVGEHDLNEAPSDASNAALGAFERVNKDSTDPGPFDGAGPNVSPATPASANHMKRVDTAASAATSSSSSSSFGNSPQGQQQRGKNILAATAAATNAARNWSWNVIAKRGANDSTRAGAPTAQNRPRGISDSPILPGQPIGRGQPLPPPGQPLPGPKQLAKGGVGGLWGANTKPVTRKPVERKPISGDQIIDTAPKLPPRPQLSRNVSAGSNDDGSNIISANDLNTTLPADVSYGKQPAIEADDLLLAVDDPQEQEATKADEFGPWRQNSGTELESQAPSSNLEPDVLTDDTLGQELGTEPILEDKGDRGVPVSTLSTPTSTAESRSGVPPPPPGRRPHVTLPDQEIVRGSVNKTNNDATVTPDHSVSTTLLNDVLSSADAESVHGKVDAAPADPSSHPHTQVPSTEADESEVQAILLPDFEAATIASGPEIGNARPAMEVHGEIEDLNEGPEGELLPHVTPEQNLNEPVPDVQRKFAHGQDVGEEDFSQSVDGWEVNDVAAHLAESAKPANSDAIEEEVVASGKKEEKQEQLT
nr:putative ph domain-containing protein [Quercus suber]